MTDFSINRQLDAICNEFEERWSTEARPDFDSFLKRIDLGHRDQLLRMLLELDVELRSKAGQDIAGDDYVTLGEQAVSLVGDLLASDPGETVSPPISLDPDSTRTSPKTASTASNQIGPYKLLQQIGEGGMGTVWMAEQQSPVCRRVALKLIRGDLGSNEAIARFEAERQALAMMDHHNIAKVLDAGTTPTGSPYFVMELVKGIPLTEYCDQNKLNIRERLMLFVPVCKAVQHAHQKGIIHRDLKPSNILVTLYDGKPVPKVIDFGLAKALEHTTKLTDKTMFTEFGKVVGTLQYMSPEQAEVNALDVDTRTDVYSLGVMLYELLTGSTPLEHQTLVGNALLRVLEMIREVDPPRPSTRLSSSGDSVSGIGERRKITPSKLQQILRGELDWVVMKALEKDRTRRYETANDLAEDINHYINGEIVAARPPSTAYKLRKFVNKNRGLVATATTVLTLLIAGITGTSIGFYRADAARSDALQQTEIAKQKTAEVLVEKNRAEAEKNRANEETEKARKAEALAVQSAKQSSDVLQIVTDSFKSTDPKEGATAEMTAKDVLLNARESLKRSDLEDSAKAELLKTLTTCFLGIGEFDSAISTATEMLTILTSSRGADHHDTLIAMQDLALCYKEAGRLDEAVELSEKTLALRKSTLGEDHPETMRSMTNLASSYRRVGRLEEALELNEKTLALQQLVLGEDHHDTLQSMNNLALCYTDLDRLPEATTLSEQTFALMKAKLGNDHPDTLTSMGNLAINYKTSGRLEEAVDLEEEKLDLCINKLGENHPVTISTLSNLALSYHNLGRFEEALKLGKKSLDLKKSKLGPNHPNTLNAMNNLGLTYYSTGRLIEALEVWEQTLELRRAKLGDDHPYTLRSVNNLAVALQAANNQALNRLAAFEFENAEKLVLAMEKHHGPHETFAREAPRILHLIHLAQRKHSDALISIDQWLGQLDPNKKSDQSSIAAAKTSQAICYLEQGKLSEAEQIAKESLAIETITAINRHRCNGVLGVCLAYQDKFDEAEAKVIQSFDELEAMLETAPADLLWCIPRAAERVVMVYKLAEKPSEIETWTNKTAALVEKIRVLNSNRISDSEAEKINGIIWNKVAQRPKNSDPPLSTDELEDMRMVCKQYPTGMYNNTLGVAEFRMGNYREAIAAAKQSLEKLPKELDLPSPYPGDLAILTMSHLELGETEKANEYRQLMNDAMKREAFSGDGEAKSFVAEVDMLFDSQAGNKRSDGK